MAYGVATPVVPVANDVILGEFKVYINYGLPTQTLIGATDGGAKVELDKKVKMIKYDGAYGYTLDSNGVPLVRTETFDIAMTIKNLYLKYFHNKIIADMETETWESGEWAGVAGGTYASESTIKLEGEASAKATIPLSTANAGIHSVFSSAVDLTAFANGETSTTSDYIGFGIYITTQDLTDLGSADIRISFHKDAEETETNQYYYDVAADDLTADCWTSFKIAKSAFTEDGTASWSAVTGISFKVDAGTDAETVFYVDSVSLIHNQAISAPVPVNAGGWDYTNETTYRQYRPSLEYALTDYVENVTLVGQRQDGKMIKQILKDCINDGKITLGLKEKDEVVPETVFAGHYKSSTSTTPPFEFREYTS